MTSASSWSTVASLPAGTRVRVSWFDTTLANVPKHRTEGSLVDADGTTITVRTDAGPQRLLRSQVHRVDAGQRKVRDSLVNGTLIGASIGGGAVGLMALGSVDSSDPMPFTVPVLFVGAGIAIGALIDSAREGFDYRTIYLWQPSRR